MRKPLDPRNRKKPAKVHSRCTTLDLASKDHLEDNGEDVSSDHKITLDTVIGAWHKAVKDHESQGHRIIDGPAFDISIIAAYGNSFGLSYSYEWDNLTYDTEKAIWDADIAKYEEELAAWSTFEEDRKKGLAMNVKDIDQQIVRAEHRLANLQAVKARKPIPYPQG